MVTRPYIPMGCTQQGRLVPTKLTERHLNLQIAGKQEHRDLGALLLASGAVEPPQPGPWRRLWLRIIRRG